MKEKLILLGIIVFIVFCGDLKAQILTEISYTNTFLDDEKLGEMTTPNIFEFTAGWSGNGGFVPYGGFSLGYISFNDNVDIGQENKFVYRSLMLGGKLGFRPLARVWLSRFQPIIQGSIKTTFNIPIENKETNVKEQLFSNGFTKQYDPATISFVTGSVGFEFYAAQRTAVVVLGNYDYIIIEKNKMLNYSASIGIRQFF